MPTYYDEMSIQHANIGQTPYGGGSMIMDTMSAHDNILNVGHNNNHSNNNYHQKHHTTESTTTTIEDDQHGHLIYKNGDILQDRCKSFSPKIFFLFIKFVFRL